MDGQSESGLSDELSRDRWHETKLADLMTGRTEKSAPREVWSFLRIPVSPARVFRRYDKPAHPNRKPTNKAARIDAICGQRSRNMIQLCRQELPAEG